MSVTDMPLSRADTEEFAQDRRLLAIDTPLGHDQVLLIRLEGDDVLSRCFVYEVTVATEQPDSVVRSLLGKPVTLWLANHDSELRRPINGHVRRLTGQGKTIRGAGLYKLEVVPRLWFLTCTSDCRIFQNQSIPDIIQATLTEHGLTDFELRLTRSDYAAVKYCAQYQETAFDFVSRLMEHLGFFYWHEHSAERHLLVIGDRNNVTARCRPEEVVILANAGLGELKSLDPDCTFRAGRWALNDYDFHAPTKRLQVDAPTLLAVPRMRDHEMYEYPGKFWEKDAGRWLSRRRIELEEAQQYRLFGTGHAPAFDPGHRFKASTTADGPEASYLLTEVRHHATDPVPGSGSGELPNYANEFVAIPAETPFRPERLTPKPFVQGVQTATVVGPPGENIYCDSFGRVRVQFHWDRRGERNEQSSCWIRVAQTRAGSFYGSQVIPHVGHEVAVAFLEGDPDRPLIVGSVPNAMTMPPMELPTDKNKTIERDHGDNRLIMQGKPGQEHLSLVSPRRINFFATKQGARSLSSGASASFSDGVNEFDGNQIETYQDPTGLSELWEGWYLLNLAEGKEVTNPSLPPKIDLNDPNTFSGQDLEGNVLKVTPPGPAPSTSANQAYKTSYAPGVAMTVDECDINSFTEGRNNALSLGNKNTWVWANNNTWVHGSSHSLIKENSTSEIDGDASSHVKGNSTAQIDGDGTAIVNVGSLGVVGGALLSVVGYDRTSVTGAMNLSLASVNMSLAIASYTNALIKDETTATEIKNIEAEIMQVTTKLEDAQIKIACNNTMISDLTEDIVIAVVEIHQ